MNYKVNIKEPLPFNKYTSQPIIQWHTNVELNLQRKIYIVMRAVRTDFKKKWKIMVKSQTSQFAIPDHIEAGEYKLKIVIELNNGSTVASDLIKYVIDKNANNNIKEAVFVAYEQATDESEKGLFEHLLESIDYDEYEKILNKYQTVNTVWKKYLDLVPWIKKRFLLVQNLGLHVSQPKTILDIGCGPSHFGLICNYFGHDVIGIDVPGDEIFVDLNQLFQTKRILHKIEPMKPIQIGITTFDMIIGIAAAFYRKDDRTLFTIDEWNYFLTDILDNKLNKNGKIYFQLNNMKENAGLKYWDDEFIGLVNSKGGHVTKNGIIEINMFNNSIEAVNKDVSL